MEEIKDKKGKRGFDVVGCYVRNVSLPGKFYFLRHISSGSYTTSSRRPRTFSSVYPF